MLNRDEDQSDMQPALSSASEHQLSVEQARAIHEIQAAVISAKKFPRNLTGAYKRIMDACKRKGLAEQAMYAYRKGSGMVTGPSIRMAEMLAQNYGNIGCGITELETREGESQMQAYCIDYETNYQKRITFSVKHEIGTKTGVKKLTDARDIYENNFNMGARRLRACILAVIPGDIVEDAITVCEKTLAGDNTMPLADRIRKMASVFESIGVTSEMIEKRLGHKIDATIEHELVTLQKIYKSVQDGMSTTRDWFETGAPSPEGGNAGELKDRLKKNSDKKAAAPAQAPAAAPKEEPVAKAPEPGSFDDYQGGKVGAAEEIDKRGK